MKARPARRPYPIARPPANNARHDTPQRRAGTPGIHLIEDSVVLAEPGAAAISVVRLLLPPASHIVIPVLAWPA
jgi:hypothetical protein